MNVKINKIEYLEKIEINIEVLENLSKKIEESYNDNVFKILKYEILREKFVEIWTKTQIIGKKFKKRLALLVKRYYNANCKYFTILF